MKEDGHKKAATEARADADGGSGGDEGHPRRFGEWETGKKEGRKEGRDGSSAPLPPSAGGPRE